MASYFLEYWAYTMVAERVKWAGAEESSRLIPILVYQDFGLVYGAKDGFQKQVEEVSAKLARNFVLVWLRLRQDAE